MTARLWMALAWVSAAASLLGAAWAQTAPPPLPLTPQERAFVQQHGSVRLCVDPDWVPFEHLDAQGRHVGIAADLVQLVAQRTGLTIEPLAVATWEESLAASRAGRCQAMSFLNQTPQRSQWLNFTEPIFTDPNVLITREEHPYIADLHQLEGQTVAVPGGTMVQERIRRDFPQLKVVTTETEREAIELVSSRKADMTLRSLIVAAYTIRHEGWFNLKIAGQVPEYTNALRMGVLKTEPLLLSVLNKGVQSITAKEREAISNRHAAIEVRHGPDYGLLWKVLAGGMALLLGGIFWHRKLRQLDRERTALAEARVEQALQAQREQSQLVALLSHEVRTALSMIDGAAGSLHLLIQADDGPSQLRVQRIRDGVRRLLELSDQFLTKDRLDNGALTPRRKDVNVLALCQDVAASLDEGQRITVGGSGNTCMHADPDLLQVAVRNLLVNALRYTPADSKVTLEVRGDAGGVTIEVSDEGPGIPAPEQDVIFTRYMRGAHGQGKPGVGLGLHLVKRVAELHGGTVALASPTGQGACFVLRLPAPYP
ncbi:transporter substrate-binding domain-containing protein [Acidovorax sp. JG5]|uniref:ATP-binding protein n=1 Tax=Acidovorax sp. JG5 TaxID=2822718 RepID=UPI001B31E6EB|nr:transporter substrate-binding domain-containing protein [Acidovorax sp. JG5]MBP3979790.1 transporter substrate-binding domain-containing protein [Acidovorax sp. JG5]